jgi:hypothetical protein
MIYWSVVSQYQLECTSIAVIIRELSKYRMQFHSTLKRFIRLKRGSFF